MIRLAAAEDLNAVLNIYGAARRFMCESGNPTQWGDGYPAKELLEEDIRRGDLYLCLRDGVPCGAFMLMAAPEPTYAEIDGCWMSEEPYGTIHRVASDGSKRGIFKEILNFCKERFSHLRIDTHADNHIMQHLVKKGGFEYCGIIHLKNGSPRLAYEYIAD